MPNLNGAACPDCAEGTLQQVSTDVTFSYKGHNFNFTNYKVLRCSSCGEETVVPGINNEIESEFIDRCRDVDGLLRPSEIRAIRSELGLTQAEFAFGLDVGAKTFARYETGKVVQGRAMDTVLRILRDFPATRDAILRKPKMAEQGKVVELVARARQSAPADFNLFSVPPMSERICACAVG